LFHSSGSQELLFKIWEQNENTLFVVLSKQDSGNTHRRIFSEGIKALQRLQPNLLVASETRNDVQNCSFTNRTSEGNQTKHSSLIQKVNLNYYWISAQSTGFKSGK
jgi:hypothetical protein